AVSARVLEHVELTRQIHGMTAGQSGHIAEPLESLAVTDGARDSPAITASLHERLPLLDTANGDVCDKSGMRIAQRYPGLILRQSNDASAEWFHPTFRREITHAAA